jgi:hypothetical protein
MKKLTAAVIIGCVLLAFLAGAGLSQQAPVPEKVFEGTSHLRIHVREVVPGGQPSSVQVICYLEHKKTGDTTLAAVSDFDQKLGGVIRTLRDGGLFEGYPLETLYFKSRALFSPMTPRRDCKAEDFFHSTASVTGFMKRIPHSLNARWRASMERSRRLILKSRRASL